MSTQADRVQARLKWFAACERILFALNPPEEAIKDAPPIDLEEAIRLANEALDELSLAFAIDRHTKPELKAQTARKLPPDQEASAG